MTVSSVVPTVAWITACLRCCRARTFSSTVCSVISLMLQTVRFWPMRWARSEAWSSTAEALMLTREALAQGVDATLQVCPYYNKPSQEGLYRHFSTVADLGLPVVLYNIPGRSGREIAVETVARLAGHGKIVAIKEAGGSVERVSAILDACDLTVLSGDDMLTLPMMSVGAQGVVSVASNLVPGLVGDLVRAATRGDLAAAGCLHARLYHLFRDLFIDTNPVPVKCAMAMTGRIEEVYRLPLCETSDKVRQQLRQTLRELQLID